MKEKKSRLDPKVIRAGDRVKVLEAKAVLRVGYPKALKEYQREMEREHGSEIGALVAQIFPACKTAYYSGAKARIIEELGYIAAKKDGFGGNKRDVHLRDLPPEQAKAIVGNEYEVYSIHTAAAGTREEGYTSGGSYDDPYVEYVPPSFYTSKVWRLAKIGPLPFFEKLNWGKKPDYEEEIYIPTQFLQKVQR